MKALLNKIHKVLIPVAVAICMADSCIEPPLHLPGQGLDMLLPKIETQLSIIWDNNISLDENWYYGWDEKDDSIWGSIGYTTPSSYEVHRYYKGENPTPIHLNDDAFSIRTNRFRRYFLFGFFTLFSSAFVSQCFYYFLKTVLHQESSYSMLILVSGIGEALGFFPAYFFSIRKSKQLPAKVFVPVAIGALLVAWFGRGTTGRVMIFAVEFLYGVGLAGMASVQSNIFPDVTDVDEMITGERREGVIATFSTFIKKFVSGFAAFGIGKLLGVFGFDTAKTAAEQTPRAVFGVSLCFTLIPICFLLLALLAILRYDLTREKHALVKEKIRQKRETGVAAVSDDEKRILEKLAGVPFERMWIARPADSVDTVSQKSD